MPVPDGWVEAKKDDAPVYEASELVDEHTCEACAAVDGKVYESLAAAERDYGPGGSGGYIRCEAGPNCRGTLVGIYPERNLIPGKGPLAEPEGPAYIQPAPREGGWREADGE